MSSAQVSTAPPQALLPALTPSDFVGLSHLARIYSHSLPTTQTQSISRPPLYRGDSQDTFIGADSAFDAASTICARPQKTTRFYIQASPTRFL